MASEQLYKSLENLQFTNNDAGNPLTWADIDQINTIVNAAITTASGDSIAYYIAPSNFAYHSDPGVYSIATELCRRRTQDGTILNMHYKGSSPDKPFIIVANTQTILLDPKSKNYQQSGGSHWVSMVLLPLQYRTSSGVDYKSKQYQVFFFDSVHTHKFPEALKAVLTKGKTYSLADDITGTTELQPLCTAPQIIFPSHNAIAPIQVNGSDCGWWAVYCALMTVYTGGIEFLQPISGKKISANPLRGILPLQEKTPEPLVSRLQVEAPPPRSLTTPFITTHPSTTRVTEKYAGSGLKNTLHGNVFQLMLLMLFLKRGLGNGYSFRLATEMKTAEKFDDVVFEYTEEGVKKYRCLQAKHRQNDKDQITLTELLSGKNDDFDLTKYFVSYRRMQGSFPAIQDLILCTNIGFYSDLNDFLDRISAPDVFFDFLGNSPPNRHRFKKKFNGKEKIYEALKKGSDAELLAKELAECILEDKAVQRRSDIFKKYLDILTDEVIDAKTKKFRSSFLRGDKTLSPAAQNFRTLLANHLNLSTCANTQINVPNNLGTKKQVSALPTDSINTQEIDEFLERLVFVTACPNEVTLGQLIQAELSIDFNLLDSQLIFSRFQDWMLAWMKEKEGVYLSEQDANDFFVKVNNQIAQLVLIGPTYEYRESIRKYALTFNRPLGFTQLYQSSLQVITIIGPEASWLSSIKLYRELEQIKKLEKEGSYIFIKLSSALLLDKRLVDAFSADHCNLLIIECNRTLSVTESQAWHAKFQPILTRYPSKKIVFICQNTQDTLNSLFTGSKIKTITDNQTGFSDLADETQQKLKERTVLFQGKSKKFGDIIKGETQGLTHTATVSEVCDTNEIHIGQAPSTLSNFEEFCYIERTFKRTVTLQASSLKENICDIFVFSNTDNLSEYENKLPDGVQFVPFTERQQSKQPISRYLILEQGKKQEQYLQLCQENATRNIHWINIAGENLVWQRSHGNLSGVRPYLDESKPHSLPQDKLTTTNRLNIIVAEPGMGKSTVITQLAHRNKLPDDERWVIKINLLAWKQLIDNSNFEGIADVIKFLSVIEDLGDLSRDVLRVYLQRPTGVFLLLDGMDEINPEQRNKIILLVKILFRQTQVNMTVSTRFHLQSELEDAFSLLAYNLSPFTETDRESFLIKFWAKLFNLDERDPRLAGYVKAVISNFSLSMQDSDQEFMGIPLQARMLAEALTDEFKEFYYSNQETPLFLGKISIVNLYEKFIQRKYAIYFEDKIGALLSPELKLPLQNSFTKIHRRLAFHLLFPQEALNFYSEKSANPLNEIELINIGIVQRLDGTLAFVHRTFSEYYMADLLLHNLAKSTSHPMH
ncbi:MAG: NACHT domain-containing protein, partial [Gammaproteobacteria bacterium]